MNAKGTSRASISSSILLGNHLLHAAKVKKGSAKLVPIRGNRIPDARLIVQLKILSHFRPCRRRINQLFAVRKHLQGCFTPDFWHHEFKYFEELRA